METVQRLIASVGSAGGGLVLAVPNWPPDTDLARLLFGIGALLLSLGVIGLVAEVLRFRRKPAGPPSEAGSSDIALRYDGQGTIDFHDSSTRRHTVQSGEVFTVDAWTAQALMKGGSDVSVVTRPDRPGDGARFREFAVVEKFPSDPPKGIMGRIKEWANKRLTGRDRA